MNPINRFLISACIWLVCVALGKAEGKLGNGNEEAVIWQCVQDLASYATALDKAKDSDMDVRLVERRYRVQLKGALARLQSVVDIDEFIREQDERLLSIRMSGPGWNHPGAKKLRRALAVLKSHTMNRKEVAPNGTGQPGAHLRSNSEDSDKPQPEAERRSR